MPERTGAPGITLTGADERTPLDALVRLADLGAEIGLLYTFSPDGRHRYPDLRWIADATQALAGRAALHVCGQRARAGLCHSDLSWLLGRVGRVQVNGTLEPDKVLRLCEWLSEKTVITQHTAANQRLVEIDAPNHALLVDGSGGRGLAPRRWQRPRTEKAVGFAGGLGPKSLGRELPGIAAVAKGGWWIDMESGLRDAADWFDVRRAEEVMWVWREWLDSSEHS